MTQLVKQNQSLRKYDPVTQWKVLSDFGSHLLKTGFLPAQYTTSEQVVAVLLHAQELNIPYMQALNGGLFPVGKKVGMSIATMIGLVRRAELLEDLKITYDMENKKCIVVARRIGGQELTTEWGYEDATKAGLLGKENYKKWEKLMWQWRAIGNNFRVLFADVIGGFHTPEELGAEVNVVEDGEVEVINAPVTEAAVDIMDNPDAKYELVWKALIETEKKKGVKPDDFFDWYSLWWEEIEKMSEKKRNLLSREFMSQLVSKGLTKEQVNERAKSIQSTRKSGEQPTAQSESKSGTGGENENDKPTVKATGELTVQPAENSKSGGV